VGRVAREPLAVPPRERPRLAQHRRDRLKVRQLLQLVLGGPGEEVAAQAEEPDAMPVVPLDQRQQVPAVLQGQPADVGQALRLKGLALARPAQQRAPSNHQLSPSLSLNCRARSSLARHTCL
jgi:hypothetical protein